MPTLTLDLPEPLAGQLRDRADRAGRDATALATALLTDALSGEADGGDAWFDAFITAGRQSPARPLTPEQFEQRRQALRRQALRRQAPRRQD
jgi:plasmid stability protein